MPSGAICPKDWTLNLQHNWMSIVSNLHISPSSPPSHSAVPVTLFSLCVLALLPLSLLSLSPFFPHLGGSFSFPFSFPLSLFSFLLPFSFPLFPSEFSLCQMAASTFYLLSKKHPSPPFCSHSKDLQMLYARPFDIPTFSPTSKAALLFTIL